MQVQGRVLVPAAAMLEVSLAASQILADESKILGGVVALTTASIPAPLILPGATSGVIPAVRCSVSFGGGGQPAVQLQSRTGSAPHATNLQAQLCCKVQLISRPATSVVSWASHGALQPVTAVTAAAATHPLPQAFGGIHLNVVHMSQGHQCHLTVLDATLHLGIFAVAQPSSSRAASGPAPPRVPVAASYFSAGSMDSSSSFPLMECESSSASATAASYSLQSGVAQGSGFELQRLQSKAIGGQRLAAASGQKAGGSGGSLRQYVLQHAAACPADSVTAVRRPGAAVGLASDTWRLSLSQQGGGRAALVFGGAQKVLRFAQQANGASGRLQLQSVSALPTLQLHPAPMAHRSHSDTAVLVSALQGMLKAAAADAPAAALLPIACSTSPLHSTSLAALQPAWLHDLYTSPHQLQGTWMSTALLPEEQQLQVGLDEAALSGPGQACGEVVISGGTGALGLLIARWLVGRRIASPTGITLWARSAAFAVLPTSLVAGASAALVTVRRCDGAAAADVQQASDACRAAAVCVHASEFLRGVRA